MLMGLRGAHVIFRDGLLIVAQHIYSKPLPGVQMSVRPRPVIHANQNQHRVERDRGKSIRRHTVDLAVLVDGDDRDPGCETSHGLAEIARGNAHVETCATLPRQPQRKLNLTWVEYRAGRPVRWIRRTLPVELR